MSVNPGTLLRRFADSYERRMASLAARSGESPAAVAAWTVETPTTTLDQVTDAIEQTFMRAEEAAALMGRFEPTSIAGPNVGDDIRRQVLSRLVPFCDVGTTGSRLSWVMRLARRAVVLRRLAKENRLTQALAAAPDVDDGFGARLREVLRMGEATPAELKSAQACVDLLSAAEVVTQAGLPVPNLARLRQRTGRQLFLEEFNHLTERGVFGRAAEERALRDFANASPDPFATARRWQGLVLTGVGGSGKSTLVARMIERVIREGTSVIVVLDFDRPGIDAAQTEWLEFEISRQIGHQRRDLAEALSKLRKEARVGETFEIAEESSGKRGFRMPLALHLRDAARGFRNPSLVIVLDTFEIVAERELEEALMSWLDELAEAFSEWHLKVVFSGRIDESIRQRLDSPSQLSLGDLSTSAARRVLMAHGVTRQQADQVAILKVLPRRPLELRFLAGLLTGPDPINPREIEAELRAGAGRTADLFLSTVYRRVLLRIHDADARRLAHPGLVLRFVTPDIVTGLLAPTLGLSIDHATAVKALETLTRHGWLVYRGPDDAIWHQSEVRRTMLRAMEAKDPGQARLIHEAAIAWFSKNPGPAAEAEATYHQLMLAQTPSETETISTAAVKAAVGYIDRDIADLPPAAAALYAWVKKGQVSLDELRLLPSKVGTQASEAVGRRLSASRRFGIGLRLLDEIGDAAGRQAGMPNSWETEVLFATAEWSRLPRGRSERRYSDLQSVVGELYPACLARRQSGRLVDVIEALASEPRGIARTLNDRQVGRLLNRLGMIVVSSAASWQISDEERHVLASFVERFGPGSKVSLADRRLLMLARISGSSHPVNGAISPSLFCLDPANPNISRSEAVMSLPPAVSEQLGVFQQVVQESIHQGRDTLTVRRFLADVDASWRRTSLGTRKDIRIHSDRLTKDALSVYRGPDPEFRDPVRFALLDAFGEGLDIRKLGAIVEDHFPFGFFDLQPDTFEREVERDPENKLEPYVELFDRSWKLDLLLAAAVKIAPAARKLSMVQSAYSHWRDAANKAIFQPTYQIN